MVWYYVQWGSGDSLKVIEEVRHWRGDAGGHLEELPKWAVFYENKATVSIRFASLLSNSFIRLCVHDVFLRNVY